MDVTVNTLLLLNSKSRNPEDRQIDKDLPPTERQWKLTQRSGCGVKTTDVCTEIHSTRFP